jgi:hypothetical protein
MNDSDGESIGSLKKKGKIFDYNEIRALSYRDLNDSALNNSAFVSSDSFKYNNNTGSKPGSKGSKRGLKTGLNSAEEKQRNGRLNSFMNDSYDKEDISDDNLENDSMVIENNDRGTAPRLSFQNPNPNPNSNLNRLSFQSSQSRLPLGAENLSHLNSSSLEIQTG